MKKLAIVSLLAFICWAYPIKLLAKTADAKTEIKTEEVISPSNEPEPIQNSVIEPASSSSHRGSAKGVPPLSGTPSGYSGRTYSKEEVQQLIRDYSVLYGISASLPLRVAACESGFNQFSKNKSSTASGVFQYLSSTWRNTEAGRLGISPFDADANVHMAIKSIASGGISNWNASHSCWSK